MLVMLYLNVPTTAQSHLSAGETATGDGSNKQGGRERERERIKEKKKSWGVNALRPESIVHSRRRHVFTISIIYYTTFQ